MRAAVTLIVAGGGVAFYALASSVFGDGYIGMPKHAVAFPIGIAAETIGVFWILGRYGVTQSKKYIFPVTTG